MSIGDPLCPTCGNYLSLHTSVGRDVCAGISGWPSQSGSFQLPRMAEVTDGKPTSEQRLELAIALLGQVCAKLDAIGKRLESILKKEINNG